MTITDINDEHKRHFALGFKYLFERQRQYRQNGIAAAIGVQPPTITAIMRGYEKKFPRYENQAKIARLFDLDVHEVVEIGRKIETRFGTDPDENETINGFNENKICKLVKEKPSWMHGISQPFNGYFDALKLPVKQRGIHIVEQVAEELGVEGVHVSHGGRTKSDAAFKPLKRYFQGETTEEQLYHESVSFFKSIKKLADDTLKKYGLK
jgi:transcriptional regulator with XRE-family HTH domain